MRVMRGVRGVRGSYEHLQLMATIFSALFFSALLLQDFFCYYYFDKEQNFFPLHSSLLDFFLGGVDFFPTPHPRPSFILNLPGIIIEKKTKKNKNW